MLNTNKTPIVRHGRMLYISFTGSAKYGAASVIPLDQALQIRGQDVKVEIVDANGGIFWMDEFASNSAAATVTEEIKAAIRQGVRAMARERRWASRLKQLGVMAFCVGLLAAMSGQGRTVAPAPIPADVVQAPLSADQANTLLDAIGGAGRPSSRPLLPVLPLSRAPENAAKATQSGLEGPDLGELVRRGAEYGKPYSVQYSPAGKPPLFVFSDPKCPHCQDLESQLSVLANDYSISIFPVAVIGDPASNALGAWALCQVPEQRAKDWRHMMGNAAAATTAESVPCAQGIEAVDANTAFFRRAGFKGTPTMMNGRGQLIPETLPFVSHAIAAWLDRTN